MIDKLTPEQEKIAGEYRDKYIKIGLSTDPIVEDDVHAWVPEFYKTVLDRKKPKAVVICNGPTAAWEATIRLNAVDKIRNQKEAEEIVAGERPKNVEQYVWPYVDGQFSVNIFAFYDFMFEVLNVTIEEQLMLKYKIWQRSMHFGPVYPLDNACIVCGRVKDLSRNDNGLHKDGGPALEYSDGTKIYALNGVGVPKWLAETERGKIHGEKVLKENNAEVRREIVRKIGIEKFLKDCGAKVVHAHKTYELLDIELHGSHEKYLKMVNPSIGTYHVEGVGQDCQTVNDAIHFRKPAAMKAIPVDEENGEDWQQQGDVCVWPATAKSLKFWPSTLA